MSSDNTSSIDEKWKKINDTIKTVSENSHGQTTNLFQTPDIIKEIRN